MHPLVKILKLAISSIVVVYMPILESFTRDNSNPQQSKYNDNFLVYTYFSWSFEQACSYYGEYTVLSAEDIKREIKRYISWPGQVCEKSLQNL